MQNNTLVSVIIPIYNVEEYIRKCVDSVMRQTHKNIEIILVDDCSPDNCPLICDEYAMKDRRITVIHKKNGGLSDARNAGLEIAKGEYVAFVDADDYISDKFIVTLLNLAIEQKADISVCSYYKVYNKTKLVKPKKDILTKNFINIEAMRDIFLSPSLCEVVTWNKLYKKDLFTRNKISFPLGKIHEDNFTTYKLFYYSKKVTFINIPLYYYIQREGSIMNQKFDKRKLNMLEASDQAMEWIINNNIPLSEEVAAYKLATHLNILNRMVDAHSIDDSIWSEVVSRIRQDTKLYMDNQCVSKKHKILVKLVVHNKLCYVLLRMLYSLERRSV